jgi:hypothetical protein
VFILTTFKEALIPEMHMRKSSRFSLVVRLLIQRCSIMAHTVSTNALTLGQDLNALDTTVQYSLTFYYDLYSLSAGTGCTLTVTLGATIVFTQVFPPGSEARANNYKLATSIPVRPASIQESLTFTWLCTSATSGQGLVFLDDVNFTSI